MQSRTGRQVMISTHSTDLLRDDGIGLDEVLLLTPSEQGTSVQPASERKDIRALLEGGGISLVDAVIPHTRPRQAEQLMLFADDTPT